MAGTTGLEPATSAVTGQRSNQLSYVPNYTCCIFTLTEPRRTISDCEKPLGPSLLPLIAIPRSSDLAFAIRLNNMIECIRKMCALLTPSAGKAY